MTQMPSDLSSLIGSRICHDLISPIGAINNGLELLQMSGGVEGPEVGLIGESVCNASARIRFYRIAFGLAGDQMVGPAEAGAVLGDVYSGGRLTMEWGVATPVQRTEARLAFLAVLCAETALPYGGHIRLQRTDDIWTLTGEAERVNAAPGLWAHMDAADDQDPLLPSQVQFALLPHWAGLAGRQVRFAPCATGFALTF